ncbi:MAG TPA: copper chaperone PCu(A)C [Guyparkeria sp.]|nr:copper chaperone PCu(A)C [Guyparkeria sp.]
MIKTTTVAKTSSFKALLLAASLLLGGLAQAAELEVDSPWVALAPPGAQATAAFMELHNPGDEPVDLVGVHAEGFQAIELHRSINEDGMHRMIEQKRITVPAGGSVSLAPGGYHVMLIGPERTLEEGEVLSLELRLDGGEALTIEAPVTRREQAMGGAGGGAGHHH